MYVCVCVLMHSASYLMSSNCLAYIKMSRPRIRVMDFLAFFLRSLKWCGGGRPTTKLREELKAKMRNRGKQQALDGTF